MFHNPLSFLPGPWTITLFLSVTTSFPWWAIGLMQEDVIMWNWDSKGPKWISSLFYWYRVQGSFFCVFLAIWILLFAVSPTLLLWSRVYMPALLLLTQCLLDLALSQSSEYGSEDWITKTDHAETGEAYLISGFESWLVTEEL